MVKNNNNKNYFKAYQVYWTCIVQNSSNINRIGYSEFYARRNTVLKKVDHNVYKTHK